MHCFWGRGYESTSVRELAAAMSIAGPSIYNAFGDKRTLFVEALEHYCRTRTYPLIARIEHDHPGAAAIPAFFNEIIERSLADRERRGCFLINSALDVAPHDQALRKSVCKHLGVVRAFFLTHLAASPRTGAVGREIQDDAAAEHLLAVLLGIRVLARSRRKRKPLEDIVRSAMTALGLASIEAKSGCAGRTVAKPRRRAPATGNALRSRRKSVVG